jgi:hypothetical protein
MAGGGADGQRRPTSTLVLEEAPLPHILSSAAAGRRLSLVVALGLLAIGRVAAGESVRQPDFAGCAAPDLSATSAIERHGEAQDVGASRLHEAFLTVLAARAACASGDTAGALVLYQAIDLDAGPATTAGHAPR